MKAKPVGVMLALCCGILFAAGPASAQQAPNQTQGFGNGRLVIFTYLQNFDCVDQPAMDLDYNHKPAASDPNEMQVPICQVVTEPTPTRQGETSSTPRTCTSLSPCSR